MLVNKETKMKKKQISYVEALGMFDHVLDKMKADQVLKASYSKTLSALRTTLGALALAEQTLTTSSMTPVLDKLRSRQKQASN